MRMIGAFALAFGVFLSGFVISEPAPYELMMVAQVAIWFLLGLRLSKRVIVLLAFLLVFNAGGFLSLLVMSDLGEGPMYLAVSTFLALTSVFYAAVTEDDHRRLSLIFKAWVFAALITSMLGILGYFNAIPGFEVFTLYDRAKGAFQDPNVFGPFLVTPSLFLVYGLLTGRVSSMPLKVLGLLILVLGIFLSFSRAAWGLFLIATVMLVLLMLLKERSTAFRLKILVLTLLAVVFLVIALMVALQFEQVSNLFLSRTKAVQDYDGGHLGRFARHRIGFMMAMENPLGIGPMVFATIFPEAEHNIWLKSLTTHGWLGFVSYVSLMCWTVVEGFRYLLRDRPWQPFLMIAWVSFVGHLIIGNVIDTDHWRHFFLLLGIIWGCIALELKWQRQQRQ
ncbi:O-antigen ligase family protein [Agrobacterium sp. AGB01]|uniref:O-antigen ligase family protein n=1 Tax=Agrobacterium sp. AGB01 TaxID=2769302 RepID=UPI0017805FB6|nr:O-antigen ligase family protein [Agrobacterium sp. AGB01]MBD9386590.1 O-antigen ligase family protein [Agrobacterium sp. AGB01]